MEEKENKIDWIIILQTLLFIVFMGFACIGVVHLFADSSYFFGNWELDKSSKIGDTIGGITAPLVNLAGAALVYLSFREQVKANRKLQREIDDSKKDKKVDLLSKQILDIKTDLNNLRYTLHTHPNTKTTFYGTEAMDEYIKYVGSPTNSFKHSIMDEWQYIAESLEDLIGEVMDADIDEISYENLRDRLLNFHHSKLYDRNEGMIELLDTRIQLRKQQNLLDDKKGADLIIMSMEYFLLVLKNLEETVEEWEQENEIRIKTEGPKEKGIN